MKCIPELQPEQHTGQFSMTIKPLTTEKSDHLIEHQAHKRIKKDPENLQVRNMYMSFHTIDMIFAIRSHTNLKKYKRLYFCYL